MAVTPLRVEVCRVWSCWIGPIGPNSPRSWRKWAFCAGHEAFGRKHHTKAKPNIRQQGNQSGAGDDLKPFGDSKDANGPSPSFSQAGRPGSATNTGSRLSPSSTTVSARWMATRPTSNSSYMASQASHTVVLVELEGTKQLVKAIRIANTEATKLLAATTMATINAADGAATTDIK